MKEIWRDASTLSKIACMLAMLSITPLVVLMVLAVLSGHPRLALVGLIPVALCGITLVLEYEVGRLDTAYRQLHHKDDPLMSMLIHMKDS